MTLGKPMRRASNGLARRHLLMLAATSTSPAWADVQTVAAQPRIEVWKSPSCGCCKLWVRHLEVSGFEVVSRDEGNTDARSGSGMPVKYASCHTGFLAGYAIEGHVPARDIRRLLERKPDAIGLAVPAMPLGSPGMDGPEYGGRRDRYDVLLVLRDGRVSIFQTYE